MNAKNLPLKFAFLAVLVAVCLWSVLMGNGLKLGIDLRGGHSLIFEIRTNQAEIERLEADKAELESQLAEATGEGQKAELQAALERVKRDLKNLRATGAEAGNLPEQMISILKERVDPRGLRSLEWRPLGRNRIEVRMPAASREAQQAKRAYMDALERLAADNISRQELRRALQLTGEARSDELDALARGDEALRQLLDEIVTAYEATQRAQAKLTDARGSQRDKARAALDNALVAYETKLQELEATNISPQRLQGILANYVSPVEAEAIGNTTEVEARRKQFEQDLKTLLAEYRGRTGEIQGVVEAYKTYAQGRQQLDDPADLKRLIAKAGVLEYRIAPYAPNVDSDNSLTPSEYERYVEMLVKEGPAGARRRNEPYLWFPLREEREKVSRALVVADYAGRSYILLSNKPGEVLLQTPGARSWSLKNAFPDNDKANRPAVGFEFDPRGTKLFGDLVANHVGHVLSVLLDDEVYSNPRVDPELKTGFSGRGIITGNFTMDEVHDLVRILRAGSLPARLNPEPVAENTFGPSLGAVNLQLALRAGYYSLIVVVVFMLGYYWLAGVVANVAMMLNILLVLGAMSLLNAVFTLPGIAGVILTIGIAVDANVLIYERLREEQAKGQSGRMALKNAYERALSAIVDSNLTTLITSLILGWVGTEEVRGFAITLGLGVMFNLFTAVFVTRWVFQAMLDGGVITDKLHMLRIIGVPKINWMRLRHAFWVFSLAMVVMGVGSLFWQGANVWGIEFSAGTQAILTFKQDALIDGRLPNDALVRERFIAQARRDGQSKLADTARVETVMNPNRVEDFLKAYDANGDGSVAAAEWPAGANAEFFERIDANGDQTLSREELTERLPQSAYQVATTETRVKVIRQVAAGAFGLALRQNVPHEFHLATGDENAAAMKLPLASDGKTPIDDRLIHSADAAIRDELAEYRGGVMFVLTGIHPPITRHDLLERIRQMRFQPDFGTQQFNRTEVVGLRPAAEGYSAVAVLVGPAEPATVTEAAAWRTFADQELTLLTTAMQREEAMVATNFDPAIAGETAQLAIVALVLSWVAIILYLWLRFGSIRWGLAAVTCLVHDITIAVGLVAASGWLSQTVVGRALGIDSFKIDLAMVAAMLTIIGYSVNDTIVVFDRIRENRGKLATVTWRVINDSVNQTLSRTLLTGTTTFFVVGIMYVWGGAGIHAFNFVLLVGILFGTYSSVAVASPLLMGFRKALVSRVAGQAVD